MSEKNTLFAKTRNELHKHSTPAQLHQLSSGNSKAVLKIIRNPFFLCTHCRRESYPNPALFPPKKKKRRTEEKSEKKM